MPIAPPLMDAKDVKWYKRLKVIQLSSKGRTVPQLSSEFNLCPLTIRHYIHQYNQGGLESLLPSYGRGGLKKLTLTQEEWEQLLKRSPSQFDRLNTAQRREHALPAFIRNWTQQLLVAYCQEYRSISVTQTAICKCLAKLGLKWNRGKLKVTSPDALYSVKRERVEALREKALQGNLSSHDAENADPCSEKKKVD